jgi:hypothetical protein
MSRRSRPEAMLFSLSELAFVFFFLAVTAAVLVYQSYEESQAETDRLTEERVRLAASVETLEEEVVFLNDMLEEYRHGVVPCWRRPDGTISPVIGEITIRHRSRYEVLRHGSDDVSVLVGTQAALAESLDGFLTTAFREELVYAGANRCYLRIAVRNETDSFQLYEDVVNVVAGRNVVVAQR